jgi:hypothetical protein
MKIIYSRWDANAKRWRNTPAKDAGSMAVVCALDDHSRCTHAEESIYTHVMALRNMTIQQMLLTEKTCIIRLVPRGEK